MTDWLYLHYELSFGVVCDLFDDAVALHHILHHLYSCLYPVLAKLPTLSNRLCNQRTVLYLVLHLLCVILVLRKGNELAVVQLLENFLLDSSC